MIEAKNLVKDYGAVRALKDVSFQVRKGDVLGFLGPNGAGKSTAMKIITGFLAPTSGSTSIGGVNMAENPIEAKKLIGYLPENCPLYHEMTVMEFLECVAEFRGFQSAKESKEKIDKAIRMCHLVNYRYRVIETLSKGYRQRVGMAQAILHDPPCLVMDEPTDGLDPNQKGEVRNLVSSMAKDKAIILSTHILEEVESMCNRVIIIDKGVILVDEKPDAFRMRHPQHGAIELVLTASVAKAAKAELESVKGVKEVIQRGPSLLILPQNGKPIDAAILETAQAKKWKIEAFNKPRAGLDEVFRTITQQED